MTSVKRKAGHVAFALNVIWLKLEINNMGTSHWGLKARV